MNDYAELVKSLRDGADFLENSEQEVPKNSFARMCRNAADAIEELIRRCEQFQYTPPPAWIPVTERLPEERQSVLVHRDDGGIFIFEYFTTSPTDECWIDDHLNVYSAYCITHWMPLPELPKEET